MRRITLVAIVLLLARMATPAALAAGPATTVVVTEADVARQPENSPPTRNWVLYTRLAAARRGGPEMNTPGGTDKVFPFNYDYVGTRLAGIDEARICVTISRSMPCGADGHRGRRMASPSRWSPSVNPVTSSR